MVTYLYLLSEILPCDIFYMDFVSIGRFGKLVQFPFQRHQFQPIWPSVYWLMINWILGVVRILTGISKIECAVARKQIELKFEIWAYWTEISLQTNSNVAIHWCFAAHPFLGFSDEKYQYSAAHDSQAGIMNNLILIWPSHWCVISAVYSLLSESCGEKNEPQTEDGPHEWDSEHGVRIIIGWNSTRFHFHLILLFLNFVLYRRRSQV